MTISNNKPTNSVTYPKLFLGMVILFFASNIFAQNVTLTDSCINAIQKISAAKIELKHKSLSFFNIDTNYNNQIVFFSNAKEYPLILIEIDSITKIIIRDSLYIKIKQNSVENKARAPEEDS